jgi:choline dehydrogenase
MIDITSHGVNFALLQGQLLGDEISRSEFLERASPLGIRVSEAGAVADKFLAIASNQVARQKNLKFSYDYIVVGSGAAISVVARRLAQNLKNQVLLLEAGDGDLKPNVLVTENWYFNQGGSMDWSFAAEPSPAVNNRSIHQAMGKALGGGTSINGMVWARGYKNDFQHWAKESGDMSWEVSTWPRNLQRH